MIGDGAQFAKGRIAEHQSSGSLLPAEIPAELHSKDKEPRGAGIVIQRVMINPEKFVAFGQGEKIPADGSAGAASLLRRFSALAR